MRRAWLALPLLLLICAPARAAEPLWGVRAVAHGSYALDYGDERPVPPSGLDGQATGSWVWRMKALAAGFGVDTTIAAFRMTVEEQSDVISYVQQPNHLGEAPQCRPPSSDEVGWVRDPGVGLFLSSTTRGFQVSHPFLELLAGCHVGAHGMSLYDGASPAETPVTRAEFRPRRDRLFKRTWTQEIALDRAHEPDPASAHTFQASGSITISVRRISRRAARAFRLRLRSIPRTPRA
jgi:hypothetical protein